MATKFFRSPPCRGLAFIVAFLLFCMAAGGLRAYTPIYSLQTNIPLSGLSPNGSLSYTSVVGLDNSGSNIVAGYVGYPSGLRNGATFTNGFIWNDSAQTLVSTNDLLSVDSSMVTCTNDAGIVAGVYWLGGPITQQLGFVVQNGVAATFQSPLGGYVGDVVGVNAYGQVIATYYGASGYTRAFVWDGTNSTDLGDFGDPADSLVWPQGINDNGQVAGTVYTFQAGSRQTVAPSTAFLWQNGSISAVDGTNVFDYTIAQALNLNGEITGSYLNPSATIRNSFVGGGFYAYDDVATDLTDLGGAGTSPYFIDPLGNVYGTSGASDGTTHLFEWQNGRLIDLGSATITGGDTTFEMSSVNMLGDIGGFVTDSSGNTQPFLQTQNTNYNLAALMPSSLGFSATNANGSALVVNDTELVAAAGTSQNQPAVLLLTQDADGNGIPDGWEVEYFGHTLGAGANALAANGTGLTILQCYQQGTDPNDFYNGVAPAMQIVSGNNQTGSPGGFVPAPLIVSVAGASGNPLVGAPITFTVGQGGGQLQTSSNSSPGAALTVLTGATGQATIYFQLPNTTNSTSQIIATAGSGASAASATFTESSDNGSGTYGSPFDPSNVVATMNLDGSGDVSWTNNADPTDTESIDIMYKDINGNWQVLTNVPAGTTSYHIPAP